VRFDEVVELALYEPVGGFYEGGGRAGGGGADFITSPEVGELFGAVLARTLDSWWVELGRPDPFVVVEAGAGTGTLARSILAAGLPAAMRYVAVERSAALRSVATDRLSGRADVVADLPAGPFDGVVLANELLDNLPFRLLQRTGDTSGRQDDQIRHQFGWGEVFVDGDLAEVLMPADEDVAAEADRLAPDAPVGARIPLQHHARDWVAAAVNGLRRGRVVVIDYADTTPSLASRPWTDWVRTYRGHGRAGHPLEQLGSADITCEVAVDQLRRPTLDRAQADFLRARGLDELVDTARRAWTERAHIGDLQALKSRSRVTEGAALTDPSGLGGFRVLEWEVPG
jgi:SAM-dependent MidA family methyltransferase